MQRRRDMLARERYKCGRSTSAQVAQCAIVVLLTALSPLHVQGDSGGGGSPLPTCQPGDLVIDQVPPEGKYRLGSDLWVTVSGSCNERLTKVLANTETKQAAVLHLNQIPMPKLPLRSVERTAGDASLLRFALVRNSSDAEERQAWDALLGPYTAADFPLMPAVSVGGDLPVRSVARDKSGKTQSLSFGVADQSTINYAIAASLVFVFFSWIALLLHPTALRNDDRSYSLAKCQMAFWGVLVFTAFCALWLVTGTMEWLPKPMLTLLGISALTGVFAVTIDRQKPPDPTRPARTRRFFLAEICDDGHGLSFHRLQAVMWTAVLGVIFVMSVARLMSMPTFDDSLLWLMGLSSGTYLGLKIPESKQPAEPHSAAESPVHAGPSDLPSRS